MSEIDEAIERMKILTPVDKVEAKDFKTALAALRTIADIKRTGHRSRLMNGATGRDFIMDKFSSYMKGEK